MISMLSQYGKDQFVVDTKDELKKVPKRGQGTLVLVIENSTVYIQNGAGEWKPLGEEKNS